MSTRDVAAAIAECREAHEVKTKKGSLYVRGMNGEERVAYYAAINNPDASQADQLSLNQRLVAAHLCEEDGAPAYPDTEEGRAKGLSIVMRWDIPTFVTPCVDKILAASGLKGDSVEEAEKK
jgi:hypothetical protein